MNFFKRKIMQYQVYVLSQNMLIQLADMVKYYEDKVVYNALLETYRDMKRKKEQYLSELNRTQ